MEVEVECLWDQGPGSQTLCQKMGGFVIKKKKQGLLASGVFDGFCILLFFVARKKCGEFQEVDGSCFFVA